MQPVQVAVRHVSERHVIQRKTKLILVEAAHGDANGPLVCSIGVGTRHAHTGQVSKYGDGARSRSRLQQQLLVDGLHVGVSPSEITLTSSLTGAGFAVLVASGVTLCAAPVAEVAAAGAV